MTSLANCPGANPNQYCDGIVTFSWGSPPQKIAIASGDGQRRTVSSEYAPLSVKVTDSAGIPVPDVTVNFKLPTNGPGGTFPGSRTEASAVTGIDGTASVGRLTANAVSGNWTAEAEVDGLATKASFALKNLPAATRTVPTTTQDPSVYGSPPVLSAVVSSSAPGLLPTGAVQFTIEDDPAGDPVPIGAGSRATLPAAQLPVLDPGAYGVEAKYLGDEGHADSRGFLNQQVTPIPTSVEVSSTPNPSSAGEDVELEAVIQADLAPAHPPSGTVEFTDGATVLGSVAVDTDGTATIMTDALPAGATRVDASYSGDTFYTSGSGASNHSVGPEATATTVSSSLNPAVFGAGLTWQARVRRSDQGQALSGTIGFELDGNPACPPVEIPDDGVVECEAPGPMSAAGHEVTASYQPPAGSDDLASEGTLTQLVTRASTATAATVSPEPSRYGQATTLESEITSAAAVPEGQVEFSIDGSVLGSAAVQPDGQADTGLGCTVGPDGCPFIPGSHVLEADFTPSSPDLYPSHMATFHQVTPADTTTSVTASQNPVPQNEPLVIQANVAGPENLVSPQGRVSFTIDGQAVGEAVPLASGRAQSLPVENLRQGEQQLEARFLGSSGFTASSASAAQVVSPPDNDYGTPNLKFSQRRAVINRNGTTWIKASCFGEPGATCRARSVIRTAGRAKIENRRGNGTARRPAGTALAVSYLKVRTGKTRAIRYDLSNVGGRIMNASHKVPAILRVTPRPGTAQMKPHRVRFKAIHAPILHIRRVRLRGRVVVLGLRCAGGDRRFCTGPVTVRVRGVKRKSHRWVRLGQAKSRTVRMRLPAAARGAARVRIRAEARVRVGRDSVRTRTVRSR